MLGGLLRILVVGLVVLVATLFLLPRAQRGEPPQTATVLPEPRPLADVRFVDEAGREAHLSDFKGDFTLLFFGFTNCPDVCPVTLSLLAQVRAELASRAPSFDGSSPPRTRRSVSSCACPSGTSGLMRATTRN